MTAEEADALAAKEGISDNKSQEKTYGIGGTPIDTENIPRGKFSEIEIKGPTDLYKIPAAGLQTSKDLMEILADKAIAGKPLRESLEQYFGNKKEYSPGEPTTEKITSNVPTQTVVKTALDIGLDPALLGSLAAKGLASKVPSSIDIPAIRSAAESIQDKAARLYARGAGATSKELAESELAQGLLEKSKLALKNRFAGRFGFASPKKQLERAQALSKQGGTAMGDILKSAGEAGAEISAEDLAKQMGSDLMDFNPRSPLETNKLRALEDLTGHTRSSGIHEVPLSNEGGTLLREGPLTPEQLQFRVKGPIDQAAFWERTGELPENAVRAKTFRSGSDLAKQAINESVKKTLGEQALEPLEKARLEHGTGEEFSAMLDRLTGKINAGSKNPSLINRSIAGVAGHIAGGPPGVIAAEALAGPVTRKAAPVGATALNKLGELLQRAPNKIPLSPQLVNSLNNALKSGPKSFIATDFILRQQPDNGKYREFMRSLSGQEEPQ